MGERNDIPECQDPQQGPSGHRPGKSRSTGHPGMNPPNGHPGESRGPGLLVNLDSDLCGNDAVVKIRPLRGVMVERIVISGDRDPGEGGFRHRPDCTLFESCLAPLCPLDPSSLKGIWYPDEEICRSRSQGNRPWIRAQRRLAKVAGSGAGYFTVEMLGRLVVVRKGIAGLDPDLPEEPQLRAWFQKRPERRDPSSGDHAVRARHLRKYSFRKKGGKKGAGGGLKKG